jgi:hypothetical protein
MNRLVLALALPTLTACATFREVARTVDDAASILCLSSPPAQREAELRGISVEDLCALHEIISPYREAALQAQHIGAVRAGMAKDAVEDGGGAWADRIGAQESLARTSTPTIAFDTELTY